jgi:hypothetical protein
MDSVNGTTPTQPEVKVVTALLASLGTTVSDVLATVGALVSGLF